MPVKPCKYCGEDAFGEEDMCPRCIDQCDHLAMKLRRDLQPASLRKSKGLR